MLEERKALDSLREELGRMWIIDTHEHIVAEDDWLKIPPQSLDFTHFFSHYASIDIISAGCPSTIWTRITSRETPLDEKWSLFEPYWQRARNTAYCRSVLMAIRDLFDLPDLSRETYRELSTRMSANQKTGWYQTVLKDRARIRKSVLNTSIMSPNPQFFAPVAYLDNFIMLGSREELSLC
jgi:hypothetical protein